MVTPGRNLRAIVVALLVAVAIVGYLVGHTRSQPAPKEKMLTASAASVLLQYPSAWQQASAAPEIRGLSISMPLVLAPGGDPAHAGLEAGQLVGSEPSTLPRSFTALLRQLPDTQVVSLIGNQAYRYPQLAIPGFERELTLYTIPNPGREPTAVACYASAGFSADMRTCEHIVATLTLVGQSQSYDLTPNPTYAAQLTASIAALEKQRLTLRREISLQPPSVTLQQTATRLASVFAHAAESLSGLEPPLAVGRAQTALATSLVHARNAYTEFATAVAQGGSAGVSVARQRVYEAETSVDSALEAFSLLGYKPT